MEIDTPTTDGCTSAAGSESVQEDATAYWKLCKSLEAALRASLKYEEARFETIRYQCFKEIPKRLEGWTEEGIKEQLEDAESKWCRVFTRLRAAALNLPSENLQADE